MSLLLLLLMLPPHISVYAAAGVLHTHYKPQPIAARSVVGMCMHAVKPALSAAATNLCVCRS
jgi:hypothetical protein